jgi:hypothetical protein
MENNFTINDSLKIDIQNNITTDEIIKNISNDSQNQNSLIILVVITFIIFALWKLICKFKF